MELLMKMEVLRIADLQTMNLIGQTMSQKLNIQAKIN